MIPIPVVALGLLAAFLGGVFVGAVLAVFAHVTAKAYRTGQHAR